MIGLFSTPRRKMGSNSTVKFNSTNGSVDEPSLTDNDNKTREMFSTVTITLLSIIIALTILGNLSTIMAFIRVRSLRKKPSDLFILALACADLGIGFSLAMYFPVTTIGYWPWGETGCQLFVFFSTTWVISGVAITACISLDRYLLISRVYTNYVKIQSKKNVVITILAVYVYATIPGAIEMILWNTIPVPIPGGKQSFNYARECRSPPKHNFIFAVITFMIAMFLPMLIVESLSLTFVFLLRRRLRRNGQVGNAEGIGMEMNTVSSGRTSSGSNSDSTNASNPTRNRYIKAAVTLGALVIASNFCLTPYLLYTLFVSLVCPQCNNGFIRDMLVNLLYFNSCLNPFLYAATMRKIRQFYKNAILCKPIPEVELQT